MKRAFRILAILIVIAGIGAIGFSYFFGSLRVQREATAYIGALKSCTPFEQQAWAPMLRGTTGRSVKGSEDGACVMTLEALGAGNLRCNLEGDDLALMVKYIQDGADTVSFFGGQTISVRYSSEDPDPLTELMNGRNCELE